MKDTPIVQINIGISCSGKSTWTADFLAKNEGWISVNRDSLRIQFLGRYLHDEKCEKLITEVQDKTIIAALIRGFNVIVDNTNLKSKEINHILKLVKHHADVRFMFFDISEKKAIERLQKRAITFSEDVIKKQFVMYKTLLDINFDFSPRKKEPVVKKYLAKNKLLPDCAVFDLDNTLCHMNGKRTPYEWDKVVLDDIDEIVHQQLLWYSEKGYTIIILSARDGAAEKPTVKWLEKYKIPYDLLLLKAVDDFRRDQVVKKELYETFIKGKYNVHVWYDDREKVVEAIRGLGIKVMQPENGNF